MKKKRDIPIKGILKGKFLIKEDAAHHWKFIVFLMLLAFISITSSHMVDSKIQKISLSNEEIRELQSEYASLHKDFMQMQLESRVKKIVASKGLRPLEEPPYELNME